MYVEAKILEDGKIIDTFYFDTPSPEGLNIGTVIPEERLHVDGTKSHRKYKVISNEETKIRDTTQTDPDKVKPILKIELEEIPVNFSI